MALKTVWPDAMGQATLDKGTLALQFDYFLTKGMISIWSYWFDNLFLVEKAEIRKPRRVLGSVLGSTHVRVGYSGLKVSEAFMGLPRTSAMAASVPQADGIGLAVIIA